MVIAPEINTNIIVFTNVFGANPAEIGRGILNILLDEKPIKQSKTLFYIIRSLPILVLLMVFLFVFTLRKWLRMNSPILFSKKILPNILLIFGLVLGIIWITVIPSLNGATLMTVIEFDKSSGYSLIFLTILTTVVSIFRYLIHVKKTLPNAV